MASTTAKILRMSVLATALASSAFANWIEITLAEFTASTAAPYNQFNARYRGGGTGSELYLGKGDLGVGANRVEKNVTNWVSGTAKAFSLSYDLTGGGTAKANLAGGAAGNLTRLQNPLPTSIPFLFMSILANTGQSIDLKNMAVGGNAIADLPTYTGGSGEKFYKLATNAFTSSSTGLTGDMTFSFTSLGQERPRVNIHAASAVPEPGFYGLLAAGLGGLFMMRRRSRKQA